MDDFSGVIIAGGRSKMMGIDKATLRIQGKTLFKRQLNAFRFAAPCDMTFPDTGLIRFIVSHRTSACDAVVPRTSAGMEPLFTVYSRKCSRS